MARSACVFLGKRMEKVTMPEKLAASSRLVWASLVFQAAVFVCLAWYSWMRWPDMLIDFSREIYIPWRLAEGDVLYRDIASNYGPFSYALVSVCFRLFGESIRLLALVNLGFAALFLGMANRYVRRAFGQGAATLCGLVLMVFYFFSHFSVVGNYNWACPYSMAYTHGVTFILGMMLCFQGALKRFSWRFPALAGGLFGLVVLTRMEIVLAALAVTGAFFCLLPASGTGSGRAFRGAGVFAGSAAVVLAALLLLLSPMMDISLWWDQLVLPFRFAAKGNVLDHVFYKTITGFDAPLARLAAMGSNCVTFLLLLGAGWYLDRIFGSAKDKRPLVLVGFVACLALLFMVREARLPLLFQGGLFSLVSLLAGGAALGGFVVSGKDRERRWRMGSFVLLCVFALGLLVKIILYPRFTHYGFVLGVGGGLVLVLSTVWLPGALLPESARPGRVFFLFAAVVLVFDCGAGFIFSKNIYDVKTVPVTCNGDTVYGFPRHVGITRSGPFVQDLLAVLMENMEEGDTLAVLPEGAMINYLIRRPSSVPYINFLYPELMRRGEEAMLAALRENPPDCIALVPKFTRELGVGRFGEDPVHGKKIMDWVRGHYDVLYREAEGSGWPDFMRATVFRYRR